MASTSSKTGLLLCFPRPGLFSPQLASSLPLFKASALPSLRLRPRWLPSIPTAPSSPFLHPSLFDSIPTALCSSVSRLPSARFLRKDVIGSGHAVAPSHSGSLASLRGVPPFSQIPASLVPLHLSMLAPRFSSYSAIVPA